MKQLLSCTLALAVVAALHQPATADDAAVIAAAQAWTATMVGPDPAPAASKKKPLDFVVDATSDACKALKVGKAVDGKATAKLKACLIGSLSAPDQQVLATFKIVPLPEVTGFFPSKYTSKMKAAAKGSTVAQFTGDGLELEFWLVVGADNRVRAIWMQQADS